MKQLPVIAAIPNYNMAKGLQRLLPNLIHQGYDQIYVLDDASTDTSKEVVSQFPSVTWVSHAKNTGSGGARNQILSCIKEPSIIHFLDADVMPLGRDFAEQIKKLPLNNKTGFIGGLVRDSRGNQSIWNYGPRLNLASNLAVVPYVLLCALLKQYWLTPLFRRRPQIKPVGPTKDPYWVLEANFIILSEHLKMYGSFDEQLREHDIQPLAARMYRTGLKNYFTPSIAVTQYYDIDVRAYSRIVKLIVSELYIIRHYIGVKNWLFCLRKWR